MAGPALPPADDVQPVPAEREPARGCRTQLQWGRGWEVVPSGYGVRQEMVRPQLCKCRQRDPQAEFCQLQPHRPLMRLTGHFHGAVKNDLRKTSTHPKGNWSTCTHCDANMAGAAQAIDSLMSLRWGDGR